ncbi:MAG TPA: cysteine desulfurase family protein [Bacteroidota bacterium]|nr:cysteine desulfurase family protein [Bacteroidota bacterium]
MSTTTLVYLDNAATTRLDARVREAMLPFLDMEFGNPSSLHAAGRAARVAVERARAHVAALIGATPAEIIFTSGGTEGDNTALAFARLRAGKDRPPVIVTSPAEHQAVLAPCAMMTDADIRYLAVDAGAVPDVTAITGPFDLLSVMQVNNETGGVLDLRAAASLAREAGGLLHSDLVQSAGKIPIDVQALGVDIAVLSAHKIHGPKGIGALYLRSGVEMARFMHGGSQERGRRGGTENVAAIVGFGEAARLALVEMEQRRMLWTALRAQACDLLRSELPHCIINEASGEVSPAILSVSFPWEHYAVDGELLLLELDLHGVAASGGSACTAGSFEASHVMRAIGHDARTARATVRLSFGAFTTRDEVDFALRTLIAAVRRFTVVG